MKNLLFFSVIAMLMSSVSLSKASEIQKILESEDSNKQLKIKEWSIDKTKDEIVREMYQLSIGYKKALINKDRKIKELERKNEILLEREKLKIEREKEKMERMRKEMETILSRQKYCYEQPLNR